MEEIKKNRFSIEEEVPAPEEEPTPQQYEENIDDLYEEPRDYGKPKSNTLTTILWTFFALLFISIIGGGIWYQFFNKKNINNEISISNPEKLLDRNNINDLLERPYLPQSSLDKNLAKCINLYKDKYFKKAMVQCEDLINSPTGDREKSIALTVIGVILHESGRYSLAVDRFNKAILYDPENVHAYYNLTLTYKTAGKFEDAKRTILKAKELAPNDSRVALLAGNILNEVNDPKNAIETYKEGISSSPNDPYLTYNLALSLYKQGNIPEAIESFRKSIFIAGNGQIAELSHAHLGSIFFHREDYTAAEHHFREAVKLKPNDSRYLYNLGIVLQRKKMPAEAVKYFEKSLEAGSNDPELYRYIAESFEDMKMPSIAINSLQKALRVRPNDVDTMFQLADMYYKMGNLSDAEDMFKRIVQSTPGDTNTEFALINLGIILNDMERYSESIKHLERAISLNPENDTAFYNIGIAYKNAGYPTKAIESWRKAFRIDNKNFKAIEAIGDYYSESNFLIESIKEYEIVIGNHPDNYRLKLKLADSYFKLKNFEASESILNDVLQNSKDGNEIKLAHRKLALVYSETGSENKVKAKDEAYRGAHIDPDDMESKLVLSKVLIDSNSLVDREKAIDELKAIVRSDVNPRIASKAYNYLGLCYYKNGDYKKAIREFQNSIDLDPTMTEAYDNKRAARASYEDSLQSNNKSLPF